VLIEKNVKANRLRFTTDVEAAIKHADIVFIAVGTPPAKDGSADLTAVFAVAELFGKTIDRYKVIVDKSTVPVGTAARVRDIIRRETTHPFSVVSNPEFLKQGAAVEDFLKPDRVVIGAEDDKARRIMKELYAPFTRTGAPVMVMDCASAELCKYAANALLATKISFMNEVANICELFGADVDEVRRAIGSDRRIGSSFLFPGVGYGGSCFPKDVKAIVHFSGEKGYDFKILKAVDNVNQRQKGRLVEKMTAHFGSLKGKSIALWGLAFKPRTDDMREAPAITIVEKLVAAGAKVQAFDPEAMKVAKGLFGSRITLVDKSYDALKGADALAIVTEWNEFREPDFAKMRKLLKNPVVFDGRNIYRPEVMRKQGFTYYAIGKP
jgi:UDPglucose 6-dehydrogenase